VTAGIQSNKEEKSRNALELLDELAETQIVFFKTAIPQTVAAVMPIVTATSLEESTRRSAMELLLTLCELRAGAVKRIAIKKYRRVEHNLYAFVELEKADEVAKAVEMLNGKELGGAAVVVEVARRPFPRKRPFRKGKKAAAPAAAAGAAAAANAAPAATEEKKGGRPRRGRFQRRRRAPADAPLSKDVAYVGNLPYIVDEDGMKDIFEGCKFLEVRVVRRQRDNRSKGFGFVTFANEEDRAAAIKLADGSVVEGRKIHVSAARVRVEKPKAEEPAPASN